MKVTSVETRRLSGTLLAFCLDISRYPLLLNGGRHETQTDVVRDEPSITTQKRA